MNNDDQNRASAKVSCMKPFILDRGRRIRDRCEHNTNALRPAADVWGLWPKSCYERISLWLVGEACGRKLSRSVLSLQTKYFESTRTPHLLPKYKINKFHACYLDVAMETKSSLSTISPLLLLQYKIKGFMHETFANLCRTAHMQGFMHEAFAELWLLHAKS